MRKLFQDQKTNHQQDSIKQANTFKHQIAHTFKHQFAEQSVSLYKALASKKEDDSVLKSIESLQAETKIMAQADLELLKRQEDLLTIFGQMVIYQEQKDDFNAKSTTEIQKRLEILGRKDEALLVHIDSIMAKRGEEILANVNTREQAMQARF